MDFDESSRIAAKHSCSPARHRPITDGVFLSHPDVRDVNPPG
jgi:hypothetical protein